MIAFATHVTRTRFRLAKLTASAPVFSPLVIDSLEFARHGRVIEGAVPLACLQRLEDDLLAAEGDFSVRLQGWQDDDGKSWLRLTVAGGVRLCCQRCLEDIDLPLSVVSRLQLIRPGEDWPDDDLENDEADAIAAEKELDVLALIEDEVLLALPTAPRHAQCQPPQTAEIDYGSSPFMALAVLKKH